MIVNVGQYRNQAVSSGTSEAQSGSRAGVTSRNVDTHNAEKQPEGDSVSLSVQAKELFQEQRKTADPAAAKAEAKAHVAEMLGAFTAELKESMPEAAEVIFGVMQEHLEESLESAERQSRQFKEEAERLAEAAEQESTSQTSSEAVETPSVAGADNGGQTQGKKDGEAVEGGNTEPAPERKKGNAAAGGYTAAATGKTASAGGMSFSRTA